MAVRTTPEQHSLGRSVALHLLPGAATVAAFYLLVPVAGRLGFPPIFAFLLALPLVLVPIELGYLLYRHHRASGRGALRPRPLLPRIDRLGAWAPVVNASLFTLYHFWSPWQLPVRVLQTLPFIYAVWRTRSIYLGIVVHCPMNTIGAVGVVPRMLSGA